jgi:hypothetical protein
VDQRHEQALGQGNALHRFSNIVDGNRLGAPGQSRLIGRDLAFVIDELLVGSHHRGVTIVRCLHGVDGGPTRWSSSPALKSPQG